MAKRAVKPASRLDAHLEKHSRPRRPLLVEHDPEIAEYCTEVRERYRNRSLGDVSLAYLYRCLKDELADRVTFSKTTFKNYVTSNG